MYYVLKGISPEKSGPIRSVVQEEIREKKCYNKSVARENLRGGRNSQNLRSREGFCKKLKGWRGVWGAALAKFLILMLF